MSSPIAGRPQVVYIAGAGHSGSTVLDIALGNHPEIVSVGELHKLHRSGWRTAENRRCSCGEAVHECPRWSAIRSSWEERVGGDRLDEYIRLQRRYESSFRCWWRLLRDSRERAPLFERYLDLTAALFEAIVEVTGKPAVADSSKKPNRAFAMAQSERLEVKVLHLIRDGRGVVWSQSKPRKQDVEGGIPVDHVAAAAWKTSSRWAFRNLECDWLARRLGPEHVARVSYERFTHDPRATMADVGAFLGRDLTRLGSDLAAGEEMAVVHLVAGNALRMGGGIVLRPVGDWTSKLPSRDRRTFWTLAGWLARRYGYER